MKYTLLKNKVTGERSIRIAGGETVRESEDLKRYTELRRKAIVNINRAVRNEAMRDCGLVPYRTDSGSIAWE